LVKPGFGVARRHRHMRQCPVSGCGAYLSGRYGYCKRCSKRNGSSKKPSVFSRHGDHNRGKRRRLATSVPGLPPNTNRTSTNVNGAAHGRGGGGSGGGGSGGGGSGGSGGGGA